MPERYNPKKTKEIYITALPKSRFVVYYRPIFLISFLQEVLLSGDILFQSDFCFMRKDLRYRLRSFEFRRCGRVEKKNRRSLKICPGAKCAGHSTRRSSILDTMRTGRNWPVMYKNRKSGY